MMFPKPITWRSEKYLAFVREHNCILCKALSNQRPKPANNIVAHHESLGLGVMGGKCPDSHTVPLCAWCHAHRHGSAWHGWDLEGVLIERIIIKLLTEFLQGGKVNVNTGADSNYW